MGSEPTEQRREARRGRIALLLTICGALLLPFLVIAVIAWWKPLLLPRPAGYAGCDSLWIHGPARKQCYLQEMAEALDARGPRAVDELDRYARRHLSLGENCHAYMHIVVPAFAHRQGVSPASLARMAPKGQSPNCAAGYLHALYAVAGERSQSESELIASGTLCESFTERIRRLNCTHGMGHAMYSAHRGDREKAIRGCYRAFDAQPAVDCSAGALHEYWVQRAAEALDDRRGSPLPTPLHECRRIVQRLKAACWVRAMEAQVTVHKPDIDRWSAEFVSRRCRRNPAPERSACVSGYMWVWGRYLTLTQDDQFGACADLDRSWLVGCLRGITVFGDQTSVELLAECARLPRNSRSTCAFEIGRVNAVLHGVDSAIAACDGMSASDQRSACERGVRHVDDAAETVF